MSNLWSSQQQPGMHTPAHTTSSFNPGTPMPNPFNRQQPTQGQTTLTSWVNPPSIQNPLKTSQQPLSGHQNYQIPPHLTAIHNNNSNQINGSITFGRQSAQPSIISTSNYAPRKPPPNNPLDDLTIKTPPSNPLDTIQMIKWAKPPPGGTSTIFTTTGWDGTARIYQITPSGPSTPSTLDQIHSIQFESEA